jgi:hypothetical protein
MLSRTLFLPVLLLATPAFAAEIKCEGVFAADSSAQRVEDTFGKENVVTGESPGPEGSTIIATTVFPDDPAKTMVFGWWDEENHRDLSYVDIPDADNVAGLQAGMTVKEVEALNGEGFTMTGFWWDYGGYASFQSGKLATIDGGCILSANFLPDENALPGDADVEAVSGDREVPSTEPLLEKLNVRVDAVTIGYPFPGMEEEGGDAPEEDTRG